MPQTEPQVVEGLAVARIRIAEGQPLDGSPKVRRGRVEFSAAEMPAPQRIVAAAVERITPQRFTPVQRRASRGVAILLKVRPDDEEFVDAGYRLGRGRLGGWRRHFAVRSDQADTQ